MEPDLRLNLRQKAADCLLPQEQDEGQAGRIN
jgi:hypothetical protein